MSFIEIQSAGINFVVDITPAGYARLIHFSPLPFDREAYHPDNYTPSVEA